LVTPAVHAPYVEVVVDARTSIPGDRFTYECPPDLELALGHLVRVPFGQRTLHGVVVGLLDELKLDYVKPVLGLVHPEPVLDAAHLKLAEWVARYYRASLFDAVAPMLPPGLRGRSRTTVHLVEDAVEPPTLPAGATRLLSYLRSNSRAQQVAVLTRNLGPWVPNAARALIHAGLLEERMPEQTARPREQRTAQVVRLAIAAADVTATVDSLARAPRQASLLAYLGTHATATHFAPALRREFGASAVAGIVDKGLVTITEEVLVLHPTGGRVGEPPLLPTGPQSGALAAINAAQDNPSSSLRTFLLEGVTGSGKTEVYLQALAHCMSAGKRAIVLVPELSLTPQTVARFEARFPGEVALLHSGLSPARAWEEWWAVHRGERRIVVGPRSALFAPQRDLGLVILDEEHEWTYKQVDGAPRYHARDVANQLARITGATVVLGSATPDLGTAYAAERGAIGRLVLPSRIERSGATASLPDVRVVDMRDELRQGNSSVFSRQLQERLHHTLETGKQAILFLNRRGSAGIVECRNCGHVVKCSRCDTPLTLHGTGPTGGTLVCHHCNKRRQVPTKCPNCRSARIRSLGAGTQKIVDEVNALLPNARVLRWDRDTASTAASHADILNAFESGEADILVGTQMIAKGLDLPSVTLVGVVLADLGLNLPDFRAPERTFQLLTQVAGRAGRGSTHGEVLIQTYQPEHYAIQAAALQDYPAFYQQEMQYRREHGNPPLTRLVRLVFGHSQPTTARQEAETLANRLRQVAREWDMHDVDVVGPAPGYPPRLRGAWRWHVFIRAANPQLLLDKVELPPAWLTDVDPVNVI
jgi:primosomal protein N' (replication factor Y) (superfamily II helicase)